MYISLRNENEFTFFIHFLFFVGWFVNFCSFVEFSLKGSVMEMYTAESQSTAPQMPVTKGALLSMPSSSGGSVDTCLNGPNRVPQGDLLLGG